MKKVCVISDIHGYLYDVPQCDILLICGDIVPLEVQRNFEKSLEWLSGKFKEWLSNIDAKDVVMVWGNHDFVGQCNGDFKSTLNNIIKDLGITVLEDELIEIRGIRIYGTPYGDYPMGWAFGENCDKLKKRYSNIPEKLDILITHEAPRLLWYDVIFNEYSRGRHLGSEELANAVRKKKPKYHFFGHIHEGDHEMKEISGTNYCNVSLKNDLYVIDYEPLMVTL